MMVLDERLQIAGKGKQNSRRTVANETQNKILLSGKILRTGFSVLQFPICASRGFFTLMAAKAINGH